MGGEAGSPEGVSGGDAGNRQGRLGGHLRLAPLHVGERPHRSSGPRRGITGFFCRSWAPVQEDHTRCINPVLLPDASPLLIRLWGFHRQEGWEEPDRNPITISSADQHPGCPSGGQAELRRVPHAYHQGQRGQPADGNKLADPDRDRYPIVGPRRLP